MVDTSQHPQRAGSLSHSSHEKWSSQRRTCPSDKVMPNTSPFFPYTWPTSPLTNSKRWIQELCGNTSTAFKFCARSWYATSSRKSLQRAPTSKPDKQLPFGNNSAWNMDHECHKSLLLVNRVYLHDHIFFCIWRVVLWSNKRALKHSFNEHDRHWWDQ